MVKKLSQVSLPLMLILVAVQCATEAFAAPRRPNVLLIAIDDLRPELGCYGADHVQSPHIDALSRSGLTFQRAYCQQAVCNPSRTSLMTGMRPESIGVTGNHVHFRDKHADVVTLSQHFKNHGYHAQSIGKIYHGVFPEGASKTVWDTMGDPPSWSVPTTRFGPRYYYTEEGAEQAKASYLAMYKPANPGPDDWTQKLVFGPMTEAPDVPDNALYDGKVADAAVSALQSLKGRPEQPFFLAVGFIKPHTPFVAPKKYFAMYSESDIDLPSNQELPTGAPEFAGHGSGEIRRYTDQPGRGPIPTENQRRMRHAYRACTTFTDAQVGRVLAELERLGLADNTIVVLFGDHGYHLGEKGLWGKTTNFELDARVPLIVRRPGMRSAGQQTAALTELVDIYPTLAELARLPVSAHLDGTSFAQTLNDPQHAADAAAFSQFPRGGNANLGGKIMGYSMRTDRWRYTEWIDRATGRITARELYDHENDAQETENLAGRPDRQPLLGKLSRQLRASGVVPIAQRPLPAGEPVAVFEVGDGRDSQYGYRIPALTVSKQGTVLAFCERRTGLHDHAQNDIVVRRSTDRGKTWGDLHVIAEEGGDSLNDPLVVALESGRILLRYKRYPQGVHARNSAHTVIAEPGYGGPKNVRVYLVHSDDDGLSWSKPREVTRLMRRETAIAVGSPGAAIQLKHAPHRGRIVLPNYEVYSLGGGRRYTANSACFSDDEGETWQLTEVIDENGLPGFGNEAQIAEMDDGAILMSARSHDGGGYRKISVSKDGGATWTPHRFAEDLQTPACMSSIITCADPADAAGQSLLVHSLPHTKKRRANGTIFTSRDQGASWQTLGVLEPGGFAYSCLANLPGGKLGCLYETSKYRSIVFKAFSLSDLQKPLARSDQDVAAGGPLATSFEESPPGKLERLETPAGVWSAAAGHAEIDAAHAKSGRKCLHILGGARRTVDFRPLVAGGKPPVLSFWAERWTRRPPFRFRLEQQVDGDWLEIYNGDRRLRIGGFHTHVQIPLHEAKAFRVRFLASTPEGSGVLIDDVSLELPGPFKVAQARVEQPTLPALIGNPATTIARLRIDVVGNTGEAPVVEKIKLNTTGTTRPTDIADVNLYYTGANGALDVRALRGAERFGASAAPSGQLEFVGEQSLAAGKNYFWISYLLKADAHLAGRLDAGVDAVVLADGSKLTVANPNPPVAQRLGVAVRRAGDDGVHTYRIPGLATTNRGTLIGVYDIRRRGGGDLPNDIDVGMSRSTDGGQTWEPMQVIMDMGDDPQWRFDGIGDPTVMVDRENNAVWVAATWSHGNRSWVGSGPGMTPAETGQFMLVRSDDDGQTWSKPINITRQVKRPEWCFLLQGPGKGFTMLDGTLVIPAQFQDTPENKRLPRSSFIYSRDRGESWQIATGAFDDTTESQVVELEPGQLMINCRYNREPFRVVMTTDDMGATWQSHATSRQALVEPRSCMASLIHVDRELGRNDGTRLLFSNPNSRSARERMTIKSSPDHGATWPKAQQLLLDEHRSAGYSCLSMIDEQTVGILYEGSQAHMTFQRVNLSEISGE